MNLTHLKKLLPTSAQGLISSLLLKWEEKLILFPLIRKSKQNSKNLNEQKNNTLRKCSKCGEEKPLSSGYFQIVKHFKSGFSYYCNECNKPKPKD